jgi:hypothetical protein
MTFVKHPSMLVLTVIATMAGLGTPRNEAAQQDNTQTSQLYKLQAAYHRAASVHDPLNGDSPAAITDRIRTMLALWSPDAVLHLNVGSSAVDGYYLGNGDPDDEATCPLPSADPANRGTVCTFFKYRSGAFQPANKWISLAPSYKTRFDVHGDTATVYFECHYFNVALDPTSQRPLWTAVSHASFNGSARSLNGQWVFSYVDAAIPSVPVP